MDLKKRSNIQTLGSTGLARVDISLELLSLKEDVTINAYHGLEVPDDGISTFHPLGRGPFKQNKTNKPFCCFCTIHFQFIKRTVKFVFGI